ncbi:flagellar M-ring protein FliF [Marichromatium gracile]|uniref:flagellar basal-body MS-ring/collar protein FliF n=1 Tax=Marichromatium gracile TaxID=1048 RepID=UPI001F39CFB7|nr:flagellar basal-body MS-ring/collar protein FliF [Marichromatium gracile]MCF1184768.1 flagellar M-ring protein FliF [Marichromatium gracile]
MASSLTAAFSTGIKTFNELPVGRQIALLGMIAGGLVVAGAILYWAMRPTYAPLFSRMENAEAAEVVQALDQLGVAYRIDELSGRIEIPQAQIAQTRLLLAGQGLPRASDFGFELLQEDMGFGASRLMEGARHQRALEGELARSIAALDPVESARVHLALPERSVFVRERKPASASVVVHLRGTRALNDTQVAAIVHLVSSSIPALDPEQVTVVDQHGRLLTSNDDEMGLSTSADQLDYIRRLESSYVDRVMTLLVPIIGRDGVRVQVAADIDFSRVERTQESFDPERTAVRSEQLSEQERVGSDPAIGGIPGALTNQPPAGGAVGEAPVADPMMPSSRSMQKTRNYEIDRAISHVREMPGNIRRLSTAVVVDYREELNEEGEVVRVPRTEEELASIRALVREAVGFDDARNDSLNVITASFTPADTTDAEPVWTQPWFLELAKIGAGLILALMVLLTIVRPAVRQLAPPSADEAAAALEDQSGEGGGAGAGAGGEGELGEDTVAITQQSAAIAALTGPKDGDQQQVDLEAVRELVKEDPKRVAQVMKSWLNEDGN